MLGVVFRAPALREDRLPENLLQFVHLDDELDLPGEALGGRADGLRRFHVNKTHRAPARRNRQIAPAPARRRTDHRWAITSEAGKRTFGSAAVLSSVDR